MGRRILVVTSGRADATPLAPVVKALEGRAEVRQISLEGMSLEKCVAETVSAISEFYTLNLSRRVAWPIGGKTLPDAPTQPDIMLVLGDRYEILAACLAATVAKVPIAHIHGGEITRGSFDNQIRDAITKLSHVHFVATENARHVLTECLAEHYFRVYHVGAPGLDNLTDLPPRVPTKTFVLTYHPETLGENHVPAIAEALRAFPYYEVIWTGVNNDPGADDVRQAFSRYRERKLTAREYHLACRQAACVIGNSSSGIIECPTLGVPTVDVGRRQDGREIGPSVLPCDGTVEDVIAGIRWALSYTGPYTNPYGDPGASKKIADILTSIELEGLLVK